MKKLTNTIGSYVVAIIIMAFPIITGIGTNSDWLERENDVLIHPWLTLLLAFCLLCTFMEIIILAFVISDSEAI